MKIRKWALALFLIAMCHVVGAICSVAAQGFENLRAVTVSPVLDMPVGDWKGPDLDPGLGANAAFLTALPSRQIIEFSIGTLVPTNRAATREFTFIEYPIGLSVIFPMAIENSSTPYAGLGPVWALIHSEYDYQVLQNGTWVDKTKTMDRGRVGYCLMAGYLFAPEQLRSTLFDLRLRYAQYLIQDASDIRNLDAMIGIGFSF